MQPRRFSCPTRLLRSVWSESFVARVGKKMHVASRCFHPPGFGMVQTIAEIDEVGMRISDLGKMSWRVRECPTLLPFPSLRSRCPWARLVRTASHRKTNNNIAHLKRPLKVNKRTSVSFLPHLL